MPKCSLCTPIHNAIFAPEGTQRVIMRMLLTQSVRSKMDYHEPVTVFPAVLHVIMLEEVQCHPIYPPRTLDMFHKR